MKMTPTEKKYSCNVCGLHFSDYFLGSKNHQSFLQISAEDVAKELGKSLDKLTVTEFLEHTALTACDELGCANPFMKKQRDAVQEYLEGIWGNWQDLVIFDYPDFEPDEESDSPN